MLAGVCRTLGLNFWLLDALPNCILVRCVLFGGALLSWSRSARNKGGQGETQKEFVSGSMPVLELL